MGQQSFIEVPLTPKQRQQAASFVEVPLTPDLLDAQVDAIARRDAPKERSWTDAAASTVLRVIPAVAGGMIGSLAGPLGTALGGGAGGTLGEYLANQYEGEDATPSELAISALVNAIPTGKLVTGAGKAVLRTIAPGVERKLAGMLASKAAPSGASVFERLKSANMLGLAAKGAAQGAPTAAIENTVARKIQGQPTTLSDLGRDVVTGAVAGAAFPVVAKGGQTALRRVVAPTSGSGLVAWLRNAESIDTKAQQELNASLRAKGLPETPSTASTAAKRGVSGSIEQQQDQVKTGVDLANTRIRDAVSQSNLQSISVSNGPDLVRRLDNMAAHFDEQDMGSGDASTARRLSNAIAGRHQITPEDALDLKQFLDKNRSSGSYTTAPANATAAAGMKKLSDSIRGDLKRQLPGVAKALDYAHEGYDLLDDLYVKGAAQSNAFSSYDAASLAASGVSALAGQPEIAGALAAAGLARRAISRSPSTRSKMSNLLNVLSGNSFEAVPDVGPLPTTRGLLERGSIPTGSGADLSGRISSEPFISRVIPRIEAGSPPPSADQAPPRTGGPNERGGFGGINTMGQMMGKGQVPFNSGSIRLGGVPSRGNAPVQTMTPARGTGDYIDAEVVQSATKELPRGVYAMPPSEPSVSVPQTAPEKLAKARQKLAPTVSAANDTSAEAERSFMLRWLANDLEEMPFQQGGSSAGGRRAAYDTLDPEEARGLLFNPRVAGTPTQEMFHAAGVMGSREQIARKLSAAIRGVKSNPKIESLVDAMSEAWDGQHFDWDLVTDETVATLGIRRKDFRSPVTMPLEADMPGMFRKLFNK